MIRGMATEPLYQPITADEFLAMDFGSDRKFELVDGVIRMMTGGSDKHAHVAGNIYYALRSLRGTGCRPFNSDMGISVSERDIRYPDVSVVCRPDWDDAAETKAFHDPVILVEVLSPSTALSDQAVKLEEYRRLPSVDTIVFVDPINRLTRCYQREVAGVDRWIDRSFAAPHDVSLPALSVTLTEAEIFARD
ncbi:Uma2 family endonuclease [Sphingomonas sp. MMS24-JH45]